MTQKVLRLSLGRGGETFFETMCGKFKLKGTLKVTGGFGDKQMRGSWHHY